VILSDLELRLLAAEIDALWVGCKSAVDRLELSEVVRLAANIGEAALALMERAEDLNRDLARNAFPDDLGD
jgi:hypothetical protein